jgi:Amt family ammonium transporter
MGALVMGCVASGLVWAAMIYLPKHVWPFNKVDDALGVVYTHGFAGLLGGLMVGLFADPKMIIYLGLGKTPDITSAGLFYGHPKQLLIQAEAALTVIIWDAFVTFVILKVISMFTPLRESDAVLELGDLAVHGEEAYAPENIPAISANGSQAMSGGEAKGHAEVQAE